MNSSRREALKGTAVLGLAIAAGLLKPGSRRLTCGLPSVDGGVGC